MMNDTQGSGSDSGLHVDTDWKSQAQAEKEKLAAKVGDAVTKPTDGAAAPRQTSTPFIAPSFERIVEQFATQALMAMGAISVPGGPKKADIGLARFLIDSLAVLEEKTKGNLSTSEQLALSTALTDVRMCYVKVLKNSRT